MGHALSPDCDSGDVLPGGIRNIQSAADAENEFPDFTIRQGMVIAVAPGNTVNEMVEQVTKPLEDYIFSYKEVKKEKTFSTTRDGIVFVQVELNDELNNKDEFWSKFKHGVATFKSQLPPNVLAIQ